MTTWSEIFLNGYLYLTEGLAAQKLFSAFVLPKYGKQPAVRRMAQFAAGGVWILVRLICHILFSAEQSKWMLFGLFLQLLTLFLFSLVWYHGNSIRKLYLSVTFVALRELTFWTSYSLNFLNTAFLKRFYDLALDGTMTVEQSTACMDFTTNAVLFLIAVMESVLLFGSVHFLTKQKPCVEEYGPGFLFCILPAAAGILAAAFVRLLMFSFQDGIIVILYDEHPAMYVIMPLLSLTLLLAVVLSYRLYQRLLQMQKEQSEKMVLQAQVVQLQNSVAQMEHFYDGVRAVRHDMKNHLEVLRTLLQKKDAKEELNQYFEEVCHSVERFELRVRTGNAVCDAVINAKFAYAESELPGIRLDADGFLWWQECQVKAYDAGVILSNGLDNAIEACMRLRQKEKDAPLFISVRSFVRRQMYFIEIENSFDGEARRNPDTGELVSSKNADGMHGIGLQNIRSCAGKYDGDMDCITDGSAFVLSVMLKG